MSEIMGTRRNEIRGQLLATASALALIASAYSIGEAQADDTARPSVWIEVGGQFEQFSGQGDTFAPPFVTSNDWGSWNLTSPAALQSIHAFSYGEDASISLEPSGTDWVFSVSVKFGHSHGSRHVGQQQPAPKLHDYVNFVSNHREHCCKDYYFTPSVSNYQDTKVENSESHTILDFQAGKDVGLGMFGRGSTSVISAGVRFAQFHSSSDVDIHARANNQFYNIFSIPFYAYYFPPPHVSYAARYHTYAFSGHAERSFRGVGPSLSWNASVPFVGNEERGELTIDWGANAALLFGRQKTRIRHQTSGSYHVPEYYNGLGLPFGTHPHYSHPAVLRTGSRSVMVPNAGGFAGVSFRYSNAKISFGYRADFFFGAVDGGIDTRKSTTLGFNGPYASISIGLGG